MRPEKLPWRQSCTRQSRVQGHRLTVSAVRCGRCLGDDGHGPGTASVDLCRPSSSQRATSPWLSSGLISARHPMSPTITDSHLLTAWQRQRDAESFWVLCERYLGLIESASRRAGSPDVAEAVQALWLILSPSARIRVRRQPGWVVDHHHPAGGEASVSSLRSASPPRSGQGSLTRAEYAGEKSAAECVGPL